MVGFVAPTMATNAAASGQRSRQASQPRLSTNLLRGLDTSFKCEAALPRLKFSPERSESEPTEESSDAPAAEAGSGEISFVKSRILESWPWLQVLCTVDCHPAAQNDVVCLRKCSSARKLHPTMLRIWMRRGFAGNVLRDAQVRRDSSSKCLRDAPGIAGTEMSAMVDLMKFRRADGSESAV